MPYSSSLSEREWEIIEPLLPQKKQTRPPLWSKRQILDGIFYQLKNGCNYWCDLPRDLPPYSTVFWYYKQWREEGIIDDIMNKLYGKAREQVKKPEWTRLIMVDSQTVKNSCNASIASKGFCYYKLTNGIKRHLGVDTLGLPFRTHCTKANVSDDQGLIEMFEQNMDYFRARPVDILKLTILVNNGYHPQKITVELEKIYPEIMTKI